MIPIKHLWKIDGEKYAQEPEDAASWVFGHTVSCPVVPAMHSLLLPCTCPHSCMVVVAVPEGCVGMGLVDRSGELFTCDGGRWTDVGSSSAPWREAWLDFCDLPPDWRDKGLPEVPDDGHVFLCVRKEECHGTGRVVGYKSGGRKGVIKGDEIIEGCSRFCPECKGAGTLRTHRLARGVVLGVEPFSGSWTQSDCALVMAPAQADALIISPSQSSWDAGAVGEWFMVERRLLG